MMEQHCRPRALSWLLGLAVFAGCVGLGSPAFADFVDTTTDAVDTTATDATTTDTTVVDDPLHVYFANFSDNGQNTPTSAYPTNFGFTVSPGPASGSDFIIDVLVPNNQSSPTSYTITGSKLDSSGDQRTVSDTATLVKSSAWTGGDLASYLGLSGASPQNPIGAYDCQPAGVCANAYDPGLTGFYVYQANLGSIYLHSPADPNDTPILNISSGLPPGSYIVAFLNEGTWSTPNWIATVNSGALLYTAMAAPEPSSLALLAAAMLGLGMVRRYRRAA